MATYIMITVEIMNKMTIFVKIYQKNVKKEDKKAKIHQFLQKTFELQEQRYHHCKYENERRRVKRSSFYENSKDTLYKKRSPQGACHVPRVSDVTTR